MSDATKFKVSNTGAVDFKLKGTSNLVLENATSLPGSGVEGQIFWKSDSNELYIWNGSSWQIINATGTAGGWTDNGSTVDLTSSGAQVRIGNGSSGTPALSFLSDGTTGLYHSASGKIGVSGMATIDSTLHVYDGLGNNPGIHFQGATFNTGLYNSGNSMLYIVGGGIYANFNTSSYIFNLAGRSSLSAGINGEVGTFDVYPSTSNRGSLRLSAANSAGNTITTITNASQAAARTYTIPDAGASANFVLSEGSRTINGDLGIGGAPVTNGLLTLTSTTEAFVPTRMTTAQRNLIGTPTAGMLLYNTTTNTLNYYDGSWQSLSNGSISFPILAPNGSSAAPSYAWSSETNSGFYQVTGGLWGAVTQGTLSTYFTINGLQANTGSVGSPAYSFATDTTSGMYRSGANNVGLSSAGVLRLNVTTSGVFFSTGHYPTTDITYDNGDSSHRWLNLWAQTLHSGDIELENKWRITEGDKVGHPEEGVMFLSPEGKKFKIAMTEVA